MFFNALKCDFCARLVQLDTNLAHDKAEVHMPRNWFQLITEEKEFLHFCCKGCLDSYIAS